MSNPLTQTTPKIPERPKRLSLSSTTWKAPDIDTGHLYHNSDTNRDTSQSIKVAETASSSLHNSSSSSLKYSPQQSDSSHCSPRHSPVISSRNSPGHSPLGSTAATVMSAAAAVSPIVTKYLNEDDNTSRNPSEATVLHFDVKYDTDATGEHIQLQKTHNTRLDCMDRTMTTVSCQSTLLENTSQSSPIGCTDTLAPAYTHIDSLSRNVDLQPPKGYDLPQTNGTKNSKYIEKELSSENYSEHEVHDTESLTNVSSKTIKESEASINKSDTGDEADDEAVDSDKQNVQLTRSSSPPATPLIPKHDQQMKKAEEIQKSISPSSTATCHQNLSSEKDPSQLQAKRRGPIVPKKPSSKIAAFQEMLQRQQAENYNASNTKHAGEQASGPPSPQKFSGPRANFTHNLNSFFPLPGMAPSGLPPSLAKKLPSPNLAATASEKALSTQSNNDIKINSNTSGTSPVLTPNPADNTIATTTPRPRRIMGPKGRKLPSSVASLEKVVPVVNPNKIQVFHAWSVSWGPPAGEQTEMSPSLDLKPGSSDPEESFQDTTAPLFNNY